MTLNLQRNSFKDNHSHKRIVYTPILRSLHEQMSHYSKQSYMNVVKWTYLFSTVAAKYLPIEQCFMKVMSATFPRHFCEKI